MSRATEKRASVICCDTKPYFPQKAYAGVAFLQKQKRSFERRTILGFVSHFHITTEHIRLQERKAQQTLYRIK